MKLKKTAVLSVIFLLTSLPVLAVDSMMEVHQNTQGTGQTSVSVRTNNHFEQHFSSNGGNTSVNVQSINGEDPKITITGLPPDFREKMMRNFDNMFASREAELEKRISKMRADFQKEKDAFKARLRTFKDTNKKTIAGNVDQYLTTANTNRTTQMKNALARLTNILQRLQTKVDAAKAAGQATTSAQSAIDAAKKAIDDAQTVVATQSGKSYTANVTDETKIKDAMSTVVKSFRTDIETVETAVQDARKAVIEAAKATYKLKISNESTSTGSAITAL